MFLAVLNTFLPAMALAAVARAGLRLLRVNAATRCWTWWAVLAAVIALPLWPQVESEAVLLQVEPPQIAPMNAAALETQPQTDWLALVAIGWAAYALFRLARVGYGYVRLRGIVRRAQVVHCTRFDALRVGAAIGRPTSLLVSRAAPSPMMIGFLRPSVVLPDGWMERLEPAELEHVLLHELAHVARWDDWTNLAARVMGAFVGLHPVAAFVLRRIAKERELACDDWVVASTGEARRYAASLAKVFEMSRTQPELLATGITGSQLGDRVEQLLAQGRQFAKGASVMKLATMVIALAGLTAIGSQSPMLVAFAQEVMPAGPTAPAAPRSPAAPKAPLAPRAPAAPPAPRAAEVVREATLEQLLAKDQEIKVQAEALVLREAQLDKERAEVLAREAELQGMRELVQPQQENLQQQLKAIQEQMKQLERQLQMIQSRLR